MANKMYITFHKKDQNSVLPFDGSFVSHVNGINISTASSEITAPAGAEYASIWADVDYYVKTGTTGTVTAAADNTNPARPAYYVEKIAVVGGATKISGLAIA